MKHSLAVGALAVCGALVALTTPAQADPPDHATGGGQGVASHHTGVDTAAERRAVRSYWTKARMRAAVPRDLVRPNGKPSGKGKPSKGGGSSSGSSLGSVWPTEQKTIGKVFFKLGGTSYVCSGNAVDLVGDAVTSPSVVSTAGHCVNNGGSTFATDFMFVPAYDAKKSTALQPYGSYVASTLVTTSQWQAQGASKWDYDIGFARVAGSGSNTLGGRVGSTDIAFQATEPRSAGIDYTIDVHSFGYPAARPYNGRDLVSCWGGTGADTVGGSGDYRLACNMTGGSSGGPWILDSAGTVGSTQVSVNSFGYRGEKNAMYGPVLGPTARAVYESVR